MTAMKDLSEARRIVEQQRGEIERLRQEVTMLRQEYAADTVEIAKLNAMLDEQRGEIERLKAELAVTNIEAARYRWLRDSMRFDSDPHGKHTMVFPYELAAPWHDFHKDWISERFTASVDKTVDAAIEQEQSK